MKKGFWKKTAEWLLIAGGLNWGLTVVNFNLVQWLAEVVKIPAIEPIVYSAVGISAVILLLNKLKN